MISVQHRLESWTVRTPAFENPWVPRFQNSGLLVGIKSSYSQFAVSPTRTDKDDVRKTVDVWNRLDGRNCTGRTIPLCPNLALLCRFSPVYKPSAVSRQMIFWELCLVVDRIKNRSLETIQIPESFYFLSSRNDCKTTSKQCWYPHSECHNAQAGQSTLFSLLVPFSGQLLSLPERFWDEYQPESWIDRVWNHCSCIRDDRLRPTKESLLFIDKKGLIRVPFVNDLHFWRV